MASRKMSVSMKGAVVLNKMKSDELQKKVKHLRKTRDETLMELKAERLRLALKKIHEERQAALQNDNEIIELEGKVCSKKNTSINSNRLVLPPLINKSRSNVLGSVSEPCSPSISRSRSPFGPSCLANKDNEIEGKKLQPTLMKSVSVDSLITERTRTRNSLPEPASFTFTEDNIEKQKLKERIPLDSKQPWQVIRKHLYGTKPRNHVSNRSNWRTIHHDQSDQLNAVNASPSLKQAFDNLKDCRYLRRETVEQKVLRTDL
eukprot:Seg719.2 transcript_id=Seg719.2/GoldUCD/mRNA.D3Y31 product="hypothetical protein" protein_id=Seg719.2/GoldUCD/D3Y31